MMITNIQHFLEEDGKVPDLPAEAQELLNFLTAIIEAATIAYDRPVTLSSVPCRNVVEGGLCSGEVEVWVDADNNQIGWECLECRDEGVISDWEGTPWDKRNYTLH